MERQHPDHQHSSQMSLCHHSLVKGRCDHSLTSTETLLAFSTSKVSALADLGRPFLPVLGRGPSLLASV
jgi:hypothetical protein